ncbi:hypothetical protein E2C01_081363 [Portunus trituberculatus]|uniref:Uncharacterized protein n=1 Tax=Portunus trituberculatus TaxID=210409 RepID=A0A5B7IRR6_PORTR|nr:hypothetical protein [Portunus trituberculatus]
MALAFTHPCLEHRRKYRLLTAKARPRGEEESAPLSRGSVWRRQRGHERWCCHLACRTQPCTLRRSTR